MVRTAAIIARALIDCVAILLVYIQRKTSVTRAYIRPRSGGYANVRAAAVVAGTIIDGAAPCAVRIQRIVTNA